MDQAGWTTKLLDAFDALTTQQREAARWMIDHPADVALLTLRDQAKRAGVAPATFTRLAQRLGLDGYDAVRELYAASVRAGSDSFRDRAEALVARRGEEGDGALVQDLAASLARHLQRLAEPASVAALSAAADEIAAAERVFSLGLRSSYPVAYLFHYVRSLFGAPAVLVDGAGGIGGDALRTIGAADVLLAVSVKPYTRQTLAAARFAAERGAILVAVTDSRASPLARLARHTVLIGTETPSFFHTMAPALIAAECLAALVAARKGPEALARIEASEAQLAAFDTYVSSPRKGERRP